MLVSATAWPGLPHPAKPPAVSVPDPYDAGDVAQGPVPCPCAAGTASSSAGMCCQQTRALWLSPADTSEPHQQGQENGNGQKWVGETNGTKLGRTWEIGGEML